MKNVCVIALIAIFSFTSVNAQDVNFGATAGFVSGSSKVKFEGQSVTSSDSGFYLGFIADIAISEEFHIQPELVYASIDDTGFLQLPIMAKYYVTEKFNVQAGPQISYTLEDVINDFTKINIGLGFGAGYDFNDNFFIESRYAFQLNDYFTGSGDFSSKIGFLNVGLGYRF